VTPQRRAALVGLLLIGTSPAPAPGQRGSRNPPPPTPWVVQGGCPGEDCHFGVWAACAAVPVRQERRPDSPIAFTLAPGERFTALTGVVEVSQPGMLVFRDTITYIPPDWATTRDTIRASPVDTFYLLNSLGGAYVVWWLHATADTGVMHWWESPEPRSPPRGVVVRATRERWWVEVQNRDGKRGWVLPIYRMMSGWSPRSQNGVERCARKSQT
jgi:hypothetical protein